MNGNTGNGNTGNGGDRELLPTVKVVTLDEIQFDESIYPRKTHSPSLVQRYAGVLDSIEARRNFISVAEDMRIVDGRHRQLAYETARNGDVREVPVYVYPVSDDDEVFDLACKLNSEHGDQLDESDKRRSAVRMYTRAERKPQAEIAQVLGVRVEDVNRWLSDIYQREKEEREERIWEMWLACYTQQEIAEAVCVDQSRVAQILRDLLENSETEDSNIFRNFDPQLYSVWNFGKSTNEVKHFGNIPPEIVENLLYYYTQPFDVVFDPFAGGGSTIDVCKRRSRRYYASDLTPIPARTDIRQHDITAGLPDDLPVPDLVFLDPPYWKQAEGRYSDKATDLGNVELDNFLDTLADITKAVKRKWNSSRPNARLAIIIGPYKHDGQYIDLPFLVYQTIGKYLEPIQRIQVPYSTQVHGGNFVKLAKERKEILYLSRDLMIFGGAS